MSDDVSDDLDEILGSAPLRLIGRLTPSVVVATTHMVAKSIDQIISSRDHWRSQHGPHVHEGDVQGIQATRGAEEGLTDGPASRNTGGGE